MNDRSFGRGGVLIVLTLKKHVEGIWITKLVERLQESVPPCCSSSSSFPHNIEVRIRSLEDWFAEGWLISDHNSENDKHNHDSRILGIVNRVSDAASPALFKACCAVLATAEHTLKIPVWNGTIAYSLCGNKWRHHLLFRQAQLLAPTTMVYYVPEDDARNRTITIDTQLFRQNNNLNDGRIELLVKPNAGGFGAGISKISFPSVLLPPSSSSSSDATSPLSTTTEISIPSSFEDNMVLIQQYELPRDGRIYRVWFLNGKVQCAVERKVMGVEETEDNVTTGVSSSEEFTSGCAGGNSCQFSGSTPDKKKTIRSSNSSNKHQTTPSPAKIRPWKVPVEVRQEIEDQLLPLLTDAHCGSVEFLYASSTVPQTTTSTVPTSGSSRNRDNEDTIEKNSKHTTSNESAIRGPRDCLHRRLYFDLNLLSTLPLIDNNRDSIHDDDDVGGDTVWSPDFDPWLELAHGIWEFCMIADEEKSQI